MAAASGDAACPVTLTFPLTRVACTARASRNLTLTLTLMLNLVQAGLKKRSEAEVEAMERLVVDLISRACHLDRVDARARFKLFQAWTRRA